MSRNFTLAQTNTPGPVKPRNFADDYLAVLGIKGRQNISRNLVNSAARNLKSRFGNAKNQEAINKAAIKAISYLRNVQSRVNPNTEFGAILGLSRGYMLNNIERGARTARKFYMNQTIVNRAERAARASFNRYQINMAKQQKIANWKNKLRRANANAEETRQVVQLVTNSTGPDNTRWYRVKNIMNGISRRHAANRNAILESRRKKEEPKKANNKKSRGGKSMMRRWEETKYGFGKPKRYLENVKKIEDEIKYLQQELRRSQIKYNLETSENRQKNMKRTMIRIKNKLGQAGLEYNRKTSLF